MSKPARIYIGNDKIKANIEEVISVKNSGIKATRVVGCIKVASLYDSRFAVSNDNIDILMIENLTCSQ